MAETKCSECTLLLKAAMNALEDHVKASCLIPDAVIAGDDSNMPEMIGTVARLREARKVAVRAHETHIESHHQAAVGFFASRFTWISWSHPSSSL
jgi:hypothetical protein